MKPALFAALILLFVGCSKREDVTPTASSSMSKVEAISLARLWAAFGNPERSYCEVLPTGSMLPVFGSNAILLLEKVDSADLLVGDIAIYGREGSPSVVHRVRAISSTAVLFSGDNNDPTKPDGWIAKERIQWRVAGIIYAKR